jgi:hypothetical protein
MAMVRHTAGRELTPEKLAAMEAEIEAAGIINLEKAPVPATATIPALGE